MEDIFYDKLAEYFKWCKIKANVFYGKLKSYIEQVKERDDYDWEYHSINQLFLYSTARHPLYEKYNKKSLKKIIIDYLNYHGMEMDKYSLFIVENWENISDPMTEMLLTLMDQKQIYSIPSIYGFSFTIIT